MKPALFFLLLTIMATSLYSQQQPRPEDILSRLTFDSNRRLSGSPDDVSAICRLSKEWLTPPMSNFLALSAKNQKIVIQAADESFDASAYLEAVTAVLQGVVEGSISPEVGTIAAVSRPIVILTSNRTRELHDALKRRCLYTWIGFPDAEREIEIVRARVPGISERLATQVVGAVNQLRQMELEKVPGVAETIDWVESLDAVGASDLNEKSAADTLGAVIKDRDDLDYTMKNLNDIVPSS